MKKIFLSLTLSLCLSGLVQSVGAITLSELEAQQDEIRYAATTPELESSIAEARTNKAANAGEYKKGQRGAKANEFSAAESAAREEGGAGALEVDGGAAAGGADAGATGITAYATACVASVYCIAAIAAAVFVTVVLVCGAENHKETGEYVPGPDGGVCVQGLASLAAT